MGVLREDNSHKCPRSIYDTEPGLFGPGDPWLHDEEDEDGETELVLGVKFREYGSVYFFKAGKEKIKSGGKVLVDTEQGLSLGEVISARKMRLPLPKIRTAEGEEVEIKPIKGLPGPEDIAAAADNKILATGARLFCKECIRERNLDMKLVDVEVLHDRSKIIFYFTAPTRIDFRELVKDLVRNYRTRIELRQIGVRHETQMLGALGNCGMSCCCRRYLRRFAPVTIKMAKEQNLFLNPAKLSGICGRLLCCLANEQENYEEFHRNCPKIGKKYQTSKGVMKVLRANLFRQSIVAIAEFGEEEEFLLEDWHALEPVRLETRDQPPREGRADRQGDSSGLGIPPDAEVSEADLAALVDNDQTAPANNESHRQDRNQARNRGKRGGPERRPREHDGRPRNEGQRTESHNRRPRENSGPNAYQPVDNKAGQPAQERMQEQRPRQDRPYQDRPRPDKRSQESREQAAPEKPQSDVSRLKSSLSGGDGRQEPKPEQRNERGAKKSGDDNSIFGLPGSKFQK